MSKQLLSMITRMERSIVRTRDQLSDLEARCSALQELARATLTSRASEHTGLSETSPRRRRRGRRSSQLPATGRDTWLKVMGSGKRTARQIVDRALARLEIDEAARNIIASRAANWLNGAVKNALVEVVGQRDGVNLYRRV